MTVKTEEVRDANSCLNRAAPDEWLFVLLARDECAPAAIRAWVEFRILAGLNQRSDKKIHDALGTAERMEEQRRRCRGT